MADVFDADEIDKVVADIGPEVVVSLLTTLPKWGPKRPKDFEPARKLWGRGAPNLVAAAQRAGVRRVVAESVVFAYGYPTAGPPLMDETDPYPGPPFPGGEAADCCAARHGTDRADVRRAQRHRGNRVALRHLLRARVPHDELFTRLAKWWAFPAMTGNGIVSWIHIDDVAKATADALDAAGAGRSTTSSTTGRSRSATTPANCPRSCTGHGRCRFRIGWWAWSRSYPATAFGTTWLPLSNAKAKAELGWTPIPR